MANTNANFGLYVFDATSGDAGSRCSTIRPTGTCWRGRCKARPEPVVTASPVQGDSFVVGALNVYERRIGQADIPAGSAVKVRLMEGFSAEEGPRMFGTTEFDGQSLYGEVPVQADGSFAARVPANVPLHMQVIDKFAIALANEPVWISGRARRAAHLRRLPRGPRQDQRRRPRPDRGRAAHGGRPGHARAPSAVSTNFTYGKRARRPVGPGHPAHLRRQVRLAATTAMRPSPATRSSRSPT